MLDNRHTLDLPYWARPGFSFLAPKSDDDGSLDVDDDEDDEGDEDDDEDPDEGKTDAELRDELKAVRKSLEKANGQSAKRRSALKAKEQELVAERAKKGGTKPDDDDDKTPKIDVEEVKRQAREEARAESDTRTKKAELRGALRGAGIKPERVSKLVNLVDLEDLDVDDDGEVDGIDDVLDTLKTDWPELFGTQPRAKRSVAGGSDREGNGSGGGGKKLTDSEIQARQLSGKR